MTWIYYIYISLNNVFIFYYVYFGVFENWTVLIDLLLSFFLGFGHYLHGSCLPRTCLSHELLPVRCCHLLHYHHSLAGRLFPWHTWGSQCGGQLDILGKQLQQSITDWTIRSITTALTLCLFLSCRNCWRPQCWQCSTSLPSSCSWPAGPNPRTLDTVRTRRPASLDCSISWLTARASISYSWRTDRAPRINATICVCLLKWDPIQDRKFYS